MNLSIPSDKSSSRSLRRQLPGKGQKNIKAENNNKVINLYDLYKTRSIEFLSNPNETKCRPNKSVAAEYAEFETPWEQVSNLPSSMFTRGF